MTTRQTDETVMRSFYIPVWDEATEEFHNAWLTYRPADPFFVHLEIEDWPLQVVTPREVLRDGVNGLAECLSKPGSTALWVRPADDGKNVLLGITQGDLLLGMFRTYTEVLVKQVANLYELVPEGEEMTRVDWDIVIACMGPRNDA